MATWLRHIRDRLPERVEILDLRKPHSHWYTGDSIGWREIRIGWLEIRVWQSRGRREKGL
jgi:hypothetical protein